MKLERKVRLCSAAAAVLIAAIALAFELGLRWVQRRFAAWG